MKKIIVTYGLIAGAVVSAMLLITQPLLHNGTINYDNGMLVGYSSMVIALSLVFMGIKSYRDRQQQGNITFGKAFQIGILITLIASCMYALSWEIYYRVAASDFVENYTKHYLDKLKEEGKSEADIQLARTEMASFGELYKNPVIRFGMTLMEILPVGIAITLISAALLRRRNFLPGQQQTA